ncbi:MAG: hypothetical protein M9945_19630 [Aquamicrobium sp.]|uniref:hypothetical protein n=1 Tax=Aquamicrobium sp. TaxID=1872579 RepID=UPI00349ED9EA|nr:hypothetical protein [Aquamicrobium sp.]
MRRLVVSLAMVALLGGAAVAAGGISCAVEDDGVVLSLEGGVTYGMGGALFNFAGQAGLRSEKITGDLRASSFGREHVAQYWFDDRELKLRLYREREGDAPHGYVEIVLETIADRDGSYRGDYAVTVYDMTEAANGEAATEEISGAIACSGE